MQVFSDHYEQVVDSEIPKGKSVAKPDRTGLPNFFEIIQRVDENKNETELKSQGKAVGDHWLSHRGRRVCVWDFFPSGAACLMPHHVQQLRSFVSMP
jgi:hypothetical protein